MPRTKYMYDIKQANFFMENGIASTGIGLHDVTKKVFIKFQDSDEFQAVYEKWFERCRRRNNLK